MAARSGFWYVRRAALAAAAGGMLSGAAACGRVPAARPAAVVVLVSATANEPAPVLSAVDRGVLRGAGAASTRARAYVVDPDTGQPVVLPLTPLRADGQAQYAQPQRGELLAAHVAAVQRALDRLAATGPFDLVSEISAAIRVIAGRGTLIVVSSGLSTAGGFDLRLVGWDARPRAVAVALGRRGLLPDLAGWRVIFSGLGDVAGRQPALPQPQRATLVAYWIAICQAAGARSCAADETTRPDPPSRSTVPVPVVSVPQIVPVVGPRGWTGTSIPDDAFFAFGSARLLPAADQVLGPLAARIRARGLSVSVTGYASPDGGTRSFNLALSERRALAVRARLISLGVPGGRISAAWRGTAGRSASACYRAGRLDEAVCAALRRVVILTSPVS